MCIRSNSGPAFSTTSTHVDTTSVSVTASNHQPHLQQLVPTLTQTAPSSPTPYTSAPALRAPYMVLQAAVQPSNMELASSSQLSSAREQRAQSSAPPSARPLVAPTMANRTPSEYAVIKALHAVAYHPEPRDFAESMLRTLRSLQTLLDVPLHPEGCMLASHGSGSVHRRPLVLCHQCPRCQQYMISSQGAIVHQDLTGAVSANDSATSRSPPDKRQNDNKPMSVVIQVPPKVGYKGVPDPQLSMSEAMERNAASPSSVLEGTATSSSSRTASASKAASRTPAYPRKIWLDPW